GRPRRVPADRISNQDARAERPARPGPDQQRPPGRASARAYRGPQAGGEGQRQQPGDDEVGGLYPAPPAQRERADGVAQRLVPGAGGAFDEEREDEQRAGDGAAGEGRLRGGRRVRHDSSRDMGSPTARGQDGIPAGERNWLTSSTLVDT